MTLEKLKSNTRKELAALAKRHRVAGWHGMRKEELIEALLDVDRSKSESRNVKSVARVKPEPNPRPAETPKPAAAPAKAAATSPRPQANGHSGHSSHNGQNGHRPANGHSHPAKAAPANNSRPVRKDISTVGPHESVSEELTAVAHDPHWIHARWVLKRSTVLRAESALGAEWFRATPVIRVYALDVDEVKGAEAHFVRDIEIHGECDHWFVPVENPPGTFKLEIGYAVSGGRFFALAKSRRVSTPRPGSKAAERVHWNRTAPGSTGFRPAPHRSPVTDPQFEKFLAARAVSYAVAGTDHRATNGHANGNSKVPFSVETELVVSGAAQPNSQLTVQGETVRVGRDGRYSTRIPLTDGRQVMPVSAVTPDGTQQRTVVLSIDRNLKTLPAQSMDELN